MDKKAGMVAPPPNSRWPTGGFTAPLSIIWKPQIYRMNSKFLSISSACQPSLPSSLPGERSKQVHPSVTEFSQLLPCASFNPTSVHDVSSAWMGRLPLCAQWAPIHYLKLGLNGISPGTFPTQWHDFSFVLWLFCHLSYITWLERVQFCIIIWDFYHHIPHKPGVSGWWHVFIFIDLELSPVPGTY